MSLVLPMTIADAEQNRETEYVVTSHGVWPKDKDGNIIWPSWWADDEQKPSWWRDEQKKKSSTV
jgi:hypothetical protein